MNASPNGFWTSVSTEDISAGSAGQIDSSAFSVAAVASSDNRKDIKKDLSSQDDKLKPKDREKAISRSRQHQEDFSAAGWALRKHLDFVAEHNLSFKTGDQVLNSELEAAIAEESKAENFDERGLHSRESFTRTFEACALVDGDVFAQKLRSGRIQAIEGDRVFEPPRKKKKKGETWVHGCRKNSSGRITQIAVHRRQPGSNKFKFERIVDYSNVLHHGHFQRFDQTRGITPFLAGMNDTQDVYENKAYALARSKIAQYFGLVIKREDAGVSEVPDFAKGPFAMEIDSDAEADFLQDKNPSPEWQKFIQTCLGMALKSIDLPFSFWQEDFTNFFGSKSAMLLYLKSAFSKRRNLKERFLNPWTDWKINQLRSRDYFRRLRSMEVINYRWIALGTAWSNPLQDVQASIQEIAMSLNSRQRKVQEILGEDWFEIVEELAAEEKFLKSKGVPSVNPSTLVMKEFSQNVN